MPSNRKPGAGGAFKASSFAVVFPVAARSMAHTTRAAPPDKRVIMAAAKDNRRTWRVRLS
ncbi:MAG: hypothetical protein BWY09_00854 [Candidatus Hydrogenedentes bacterium ADurb.Bin179]|nr:MAG: hypothetical protein BWY09_00854 [Candidatus Hydrogenedentes bacterium ADurb.Bin179]